MWLNILYKVFQSTLPHGSDPYRAICVVNTVISIHAPSRERLIFYTLTFNFSLFQSTLPHGSDRLKYLFK